MTDPVPVTLDDLKRAIDATDARHFAVMAGIDGIYEKARADAWRTAFKWLETTTCDDLYGDLQEGLALIKEKLR